MQPDYGARRVEIPWEDIAEDGVTLTLHDRLQQEPDLLVGGINRGPGYGDVRFLASDIDALLAKYASDRADSSSAAAASSDAPVLPRPAGTDRGVAFSAPGDSAQAQQRGADPAWETVIASSPPKDQETLRVMRAVAEEQLAKTMHRVKRDELARVVGTKSYSVGRARQLYRLLPEHLRNLARTAGARTR